MKNKTRSLIALLFAGSLVLTACGNDADEPDAGAGAGGDTSSETTAQFNDADVTFAQGMIPHHEQAVEMAQMAEEQADSAEVKALAAKIEAAQAPEIEKLREWLDEWGAEAPSGSMDHGDMGHGDQDGSMSGMMTEDDMNKLSDASGAEWDEMFLTMMIEHHEGAVEMAQTQVEDGKNPDAIAMAQEIISTQQAEIDEMKQLLGS